MAGCSSSDHDTWISDLESDDEARVVRALHTACPCSGSSELYETYMALLHRFKKDPRAKVRKVAIHLEEDALERLAMDDERAAGFVRNQPGGSGRRGETRRAELRHR